MVDTFGLGSLRIISLICECRLIRSVKSLRSIVWLFFASPKRICQVDC